jgi:predicted DNA-binding protein (UPF0251 family)
MLWPAPGQPQLSTLLSRKVSILRPPKIDDRKLLKLIDVKKLSYAEAARRLGVSRQAVSFRMQELRPKATKAIVAKKVDQCVDQRLDAIGQLKRINDSALELLDQAEREDNRELCLKSMAEIRMQLKLQLELFATLFDMQAAEQFMNTVLDIIGEVSPDARKKILQRLAAERSVRSAVRFT